MYEQITKQGVPATLQLSTAGKALVGWFSLAPGHAASQTELESWPGQTPLRSGAFIVDTRFPHDDGHFDMWWWAGQQAAGEPNTADPHDLQAAFAGSETSGFGSFRVLDGTLKNARVSLRFKADSKPDTFLRYRPDVRVPWSTVAGLAGMVKDLVVVEQVQPLAPRWVGQVVDLFTAPAALVLLERWYSITTNSFANPAARLAARTAIINRLSSTQALEPGFLPEAHARVLQGRISAALRSVSLKLGSETQTLRRWYEVVAAQDGAGETTAHKVFLQAGISPGGAKGWAYVIDFIKAKPSTSPSISRYGVKGTASAFSAIVWKVPVKFEMKDGNRKVDADGNPVITDPSLLDPANNPMIAPAKVGTKYGGASDSLLVGVFVDIGVGLGISSSVSDGSPSVKTKSAGGNLLASATFYSPLDLVLDDFHLAWFHIASLKGPSVKIGNYVGAVGFSSVFTIITLRNGATLEAVSSKIMKFVPPEAPKVDLLFGGREKLTEYLRGWTKPFPSATLFDISAGYGLLVAPTSKQALSEAERAPLTVRERREVVKGKASGMVLFGLDEAHFRVGRDIAVDGRYLLEVVLAAVRGLMVGDQNSVVTVSGFASPPHTRCHNQNLSLARARTVRQAILDAFPSALQPSLVFSIGRGELPALDDGLKDPPEDTKAKQQFKLRYPDQVAKWPAWQKVEVEVAGTIVARLESVAPDAP